MKNEEIKKQIEQARRKYLPEKVTMLLVGEAPPDALDRFFYYENVKDKDFLFIGVMKILESESVISHYINMGRPTNEKRRLLESFKSKGYYLMDLSPVPAGIEMPESHMYEFLSELKQLETDGHIDKETPIILIKANVYDCLYWRLIGEGYKNVVNERIPFPSSGQQKKFAEKFRYAIKIANEK